VKGFRALGYGVVATARSMKDTDVAADPDVLAVEGDIAALSTAQRIVGAAVERFGRIDTLVNNAGVFIPKPFVDYTDSDFATMTGTNLAGFFHLSQKVASSMLRSGSGHIVNITATIAALAHGFAAGRPRRPDQGRSSTRSRVRLPSNTPAAASA